MFAQNPPGLWNDRNTSRLTTRVCHFHKEIIVIFRIEFKIDHPSFKVAIVGEGPCMGSWGKESPLNAIESPHGSGIWMATAMVPANSNLNFQCVLVDQNEKIVQWEREGLCRKITVNNSHLHISLPWGNISAETFLPEPPKCVACVTFYADYRQGNLMPSQKLVLFCWTHSDRKWRHYEAHTTILPRDWSTSVLFPINEKVIFKWAVMDTLDGSYRNEKSFSTSTFSTERHLVFTTFSEKTIIRSHFEDEFLVKNKTSQRIGINGNKLDGRDCKKGTFNTSETETNIDAANDEHAYADKGKTGLIVNVADQPPRSGSDASPLKINVGPTSALGNTGSNDAPSAAMELCKHNPAKLLTQVKHLPDKDEVDAAIENRPLPMINEVKPSANDVNNNLLFQNGGIGCRSNSELKSEGKEMTPCNDDVTPKPKNNGKKSSRVKRFFMRMFPCVFKSSAYDE